MPITASQIQSVVSADIRAFESAMAKVEERSERTAQKLNETGSRMADKWVEAYQRMQEAATRTATIQIDNAQRVARAKASARSEAQQEVAAAREEENALKRVNRELELTQAKIAVLNGTDSLALMRAQFKGLVPDEELRKLQFLQQKMHDLEAVERATAQAIKDENSERLKAEQAAERAAQKAISGGRSALSVQERYNAELAKTRAELAAIRPFGADKNAPLRNQFPGIAESDLTRLRKMQAAPDALKDGKQAAVSLVSGAASGVMNGAAGLLGLGVMTAKMSSDVEHSLVTIRNNTTMDNDQFKEMKKTVLDLGVSTGASFDKIAEAYMHVANFGYKNADANKIATIATKAAVATNADAAVTGQLLAKVMRENNIAIGDTSKTMNLLWYAAANSDAKMGQFVETGGRVFAMAATLGLNLSQTAGAMSVFMARGIDAATATTQLQNVLTRIISPTRQVKDRLKEISQVTGVDLVSDFTLAGLKSKQLIGVFSDMRDAAHKSGVPIAELAKDLFPNMRGSIGALIGTSDSGFQGFVERMRDAQRISAGWNPLQDATNRVLDTTTNRIERLVNEMKVEFLPVGERFAALLKESIPVVKMFADNLKWVLDRFLGLPKPVQEAVLGLGALRLASIALGSPLNGLMGMLGNLVKLWKGVQAAALAASGAQALAASSGGAVAGGVSAAVGRGAATNGGGGLLAGILAAGTKLPVIGTAVAAAGLGWMGNDAAQTSMSASNAQIRANELPNLTPYVQRVQKLEAQVKNDPHNAQLQVQLDDALSTARRMAGMFSAQANGVQREGEVLFRHTADASRVNQRLLTEIQNAAKALGMHIEVGTAIQGHNTNTIYGNRSRHADGNAFDINRINGQVVNVNNPAGAALADRLVAYLRAQGFGFGEGAGHDQAYLWRTQIGGNHNNHIHVSDRQRDGIGTGNGFNPLAGLSGDTSGGKLPAWYQSMLDGGREKKLTPYQKELKAYNEEMAQSQSRLNEVMSGGDKVAGGVAAKYHLLTAAMRSALTAIKEKIKATLDNQKAEESFREELDKTNASIREQRGGELEGLAKLKAEYPGVSDARLKYLLNQRQISEAEKEEREQNVKLAQQLTNFNSELANVTEKSGLHKTAIEQTGKVYEQLSAKAKGLVQGITQIKDALEASKAVQSLMDKVADFQLKARAMTLPKEQREYAESVGLKNFFTMHDSKTSQFEHLYDGGYKAFQEGKTYEANDKLKIEADKAFASFHEEMAGRIAAADDSINGDKAQSAWDRYLLNHKMLAALLQQNVFIGFAFQSVFEKMFKQEQIDKVTQSMRAFNAEFDESIHHSKSILAGQGNTAASRWEQYLKSRPELMKQLQDNPQLGKDAFAKFSEDDKLRQQVAGYEKMQQLTGDLQKRTLELTTADPFKQWLVSLYEVDKETGQLKLPAGMDMNKLKALYKQNQALDMYKQVTDGIQGLFSSMFDNIANKGFKGLFEGVYGGFKSLLTRMASEYLTSQLMSALKSSFGGMASGGGTGILGSIVGIAGDVALGSSPSFSSPDGAYTYGGGTLSQSVGIGRAAGNGAASTGDGDVHNHNITMHINTPNAESFRRSKGVVMSELYAEMQRQNKRLR